MKYALIIGNDRYDDPKLAQLKTPAADSQALAGILENSEIGSFDQVIPLINQSESQVRRAVSSFLTDKKPGDLVLLYFSGHGVLDDRGRLYLALRDTQLNLLKATSIPSSFVSDEMDSCRSRRQILVLDCCHSGAFARGVKGEQKAITETTFEGSGFGRVVLTASDSTQYALEGDQVIKQTELSLFTHFLLEGLRSGEADTNNDGQVSLDEWYDYTYTRVIAETPRQVPHKWSYNQQGDLVIARNPFVKKKVAELPYELTQALDSSFVGIRESAVKELGKYLRSQDPDIAQLAVLSLERMKEDDSRRISSLAEELLAESASVATAPGAVTTVDPQMDVSSPHTSAKPIPHTAAGEPPPAVAASSYRRPAFNIEFWLVWLGTLVLAAAGFYLLYSLSVQNDNSYTYFVRWSGVVTGLAGLAQWYLFRNRLEIWWVPVQTSAGIVLGYLQIFLFDSLGVWQKEDIGILFTIWAVGSLIVGIFLMRNAQSAFKRPSALPARGIRRNIFFILLSITLLAGAVSNILLLQESELLKAAWIVYGLSAIAAGSSFFRSRELPRNFGMISLAVFLIAEGIILVLWTFERIPLYAFAINAITGLAAASFFLAQRETWKDIGFLLLSGYLITNAALSIVTANYSYDLNRICLYFDTFFALVTPIPFWFQKKVITK